MHSARWLSGKEKIVNFARRAGKDQTSGKAGNHKREKDARQLTGVVLDSERYVGVEPWRYEVRVSKRVPPARTSTNTTATTEKRQQAYVIQIERKTSNG